MQAVTLLSYVECNRFGSTAIPTIEVFPLAIDSRWRCRAKVQRFGICGIRLIVCEDDQSVCAGVS